MTAATSVFLAATLAVTLLVAFLWVRRVRNSRSVVSEKRGRATLISLSSASVAIIAQLIWIALFNFVPPISNGQHRTFYGVLVIIGIASSAAAVIAGLLTRTDEGKIGLVLSGIVLGITWLLATVVSMPVS